MVQNATIRAFELAEELKLKVLKANDNINSNDKNLHLAQLQKAYQNILLMDLDYALDKKIEQDLWNYGFKNKIEGLQIRTKDKKNPRRMESQTLLSLTLQSATGFYICLLHQICDLFKLDLPFRYKFPNISKFNKISSSEIRFPQPSSCWYICQYCLVHLGDLARYNRQPQHADSFYRQALNVSPKNGQPYNQLGLLRAARGDKLGAAYFHARSLAVWGPFPPAANNLSRTLASGSTISSSFKKDSSLVKRLDSQTYINNYIGIHFQLQTMSHLENLKENVIELSSTLIALIATDEFDSETLIKMCCLDLYALYAITEGHKIDETQLSKNERKINSLVMELIVGTLTALLLPVHTRAATETLTYPALPAIKIILEWIKLHPNLLQHFSFTSRPQIWPGLCMLLNNLLESIKDFSGDQYSTIPLPEDDELQGFLPVDLAFKNLKFNSPVYNHVNENTNKSSNVSSEKDINLEIASILQEQFSLKKKSQTISDNFDALKKNELFVNSLRAYRMIQLGEWLSNYLNTSGNDYFNIINDSETDTKIFKPVQNSLESNPDVMKTIQEITTLREKHLIEASTINSKFGKISPNTDLSDNEKEEPQLKLSDESVKNILLPPPIIISEEDFKEKVKEKRAGILKPQGSLEKARVEKALSRSCNVTTSPELIKISNDQIADITDIQDTGSSSSTVSQDGTICTDISSLLDSSIIETDKSIKKETKKVRTNVAMQTIMKKQEESNKQVKFITPATTPDSMVENFEISPSENQSQSDKRIIIQPKVMKPLNVLASDRKTGGILSLKDKSGGYPHLVNIEITSTNEQTKASTFDKTNEPIMDNVFKMKDVATNFKDLKIQEVSPKSYGPYSQKPSTNYYTPWSDAKNNFVKNDQINFASNPINYNPMLKFDAPNQPSQYNPQPYSYFSQKPDNTNLCLPVINPKEIDVRAMTMQKQKNNQFNPNNYHGFNKFDNHPYMGMNHPENQSAWPKFDPSLKPPNINETGLNNYSNVHKFDYGNANLPNAMKPGADMNSRQNPYNYPDPFGQGSNPHSIWWNPAMGNDNLHFNRPNNDFKHMNPMNVTSFHPGPYNRELNMNSPMSIGMHPNPVGRQIPNPSYPFYNPAQKPPLFEGQNTFPVPYNSQTIINQDRKTNLNKPVIEMSPIDAFNSDYGSAQSGTQDSLQTKYDVNIPEFVPKEPPIGSVFNRNMDTNSSTFDSAGSSGINMYSLFSASKSPWEENKPTPLNDNTQQPLWTGVNPTPLEKLLEQQKQFKHAPNEQ